MQKKYKILEVDSEYRILVIPAINRAGNLLVQRLRENCMGESYWEDGGLIHSTSSTSEQVLKKCIFKMMESSKN